MFPPCQKAGCEDLGVVTVTLTEPDREATWYACWPHAHDFQDWVTEETARKRGTMGVLLALESATPR